MDLPADTPADVDCGWGAWSEDRAVRGVRRSAEELVGAEESGCRLRAAALHTAASTADLYSRGRTEAVEFLSPYLMVKA